jgi:hypothetical protein
LVYTSSMSWVTLAIGTLVLFLVFLGLFFWSSGAVVIAEEEAKDIEKKSPQELADELIEIEKEDLTELQMEEKDQSYSRG